jgi:hypothetical protein
LASARTTLRPTKPDPPKTVTSVSRFDAMGPIFLEVKAERSQGITPFRDTPTGRRYQAQLAGNAPI